MVLHGPTHVSVADQTDAIAEHERSYCVVIDPYEVHGELELFLDGNFLLSGTVLAL
jgi:hypothetical protein